ERMRVPWPAASMIVLVVIRASPPESLPFLYCPKTRNAQTSCASHVLPSGLSFGVAPDLLQELEPGDGFSQFRLRPGHVDVALALGECFFGFLLGLHYRSLVDVPCAQRRVGEYRDHLGLHFQHAAGNEEALFLAIFRLHADLAVRDARDQGRVPGRDAHLAHLGGHEHHRRRAGEDRALGADDVYMDRCHYGTSQEAVIRATSPFPPLRRSCRPCRTPAPAGGRTRLRRSP